MSNIIFLKIKKYTSWNLLSATDFEAILMNYNPIIYINLYKICVIEVKSS